MKKKNDWHFWEALARIILRNRIAWILFLVAVTAFWASQWKYMRFTFSEANLLPDNHPENVHYQDFLERFGEEGNVLVLGWQDPDFFTHEKIEVWRSLRKKLEAFDEIDYVLSLSLIHI